MSEGAGAGRGSAARTPHAGTDRSGGFVTAVILLTGASMFGTTGTTLLPAIAPEAARSYGVPAVYIGYQFSLVAATMMLSLVFLSNLSVRWGACRTNQAGLALTGLMLLATLVPHPLVVVLASIGMGLGYGLVMPAISHLLMRFTPPERLNVVFSIQQAGIPLGSIVAASVGPSIAVTIGWHYAVVLAAALLLGLAAVLQWRRALWDDDRDPSAPAGRSLRTGLGMVVRDRRLRLLAIAGSCFSGVQFCIATYTVVALVEGIGLALVQAGLVLTTAQVFGVASRIFCGWIADRTGDAVRVLAWLAGSIVLAGSACYPLEPGWPIVAIFALFAALGAATIGWPGAFLAEVGRACPPGQVAASTAATLIFTNLGKTSGPILFAAVFAASGRYGTAFAMVAVVAAIAATCLVAAGRSPQPPASRGTG